MYLYFCRYRHFYAKDGRCGFDYRLYENNPKLLPFGNSFGLSAFGGDGGNRSFASFAASQPFALYVPFADAKDGRCGFDYRLYENNPKLLPFGNSFGLFASGGDGGNRNRVRKFIRLTFSGWSCSFKIPSD